MVVAEQNRERVAQLRESGVHAVVGDATTPAVLIQAHVARAALLVIATPDTARARQMIEIARLLNPEIKILVRAHSEEEALLLSKECAVTVFLSKQELALSMIRGVLESLAKPGG